MVNILILGASSQIGRELALRFSSNASLTLVGRHQENLQHLAQQCVDAGAVSARCVVQDIAAGVAPVMQQIGDTQFDLFINLIAATSRVDDSEFLPSALEGYLWSDVLVPVQLLQRLMGKADKPVKTIFISSILAEVKSPDRMLYSSLKLLQEMCLRKLSLSCPGCALLIVRVGMVVPHTSSSRKAQQLADAIYQAHLQKKRILTYGWMGRIYLFLFYTQPMIFQWIVKLQRAFRVRTSGFKRRRGHP